MVIDILTLFPKMFEGFLSESIIKRAIDNKLVTIEFNTPVNVYKEWEDVANEVMDSICFNEEDIKKYSSD